MILPTIVLFIAFRLLARTSFWSETRQARHVISHMPIRLTRGLKKMCDYCVPIRRTWLLSSGVGYIKFLIESGLQLSSKELGTSGEHFHTLGYRLYT